LDFLKRSDDFASEAYLTKLIVILALWQNNRKIFSREISQAMAEPRDTFGGYRNHQVLYLRHKLTQFWQPPYRFCTLVGHDTFFPGWAQIAAHEAQARPCKDELTSSHVSL